MKALRLALAAGLAVAMTSACFEGPKVLQGTVSSFDSASSTLVAKDESDGAEVTFSTAGAEIGADPAAGDKVRLAYHADGGRNVASRVMNLTRQKEVSGGGGH